MNRASIRSALLLVAFLSLLVALKRVDAGDGAIVSWNFDGLAEQNLKLVGEVQLEVFGPRKNHFPSQSEGNFGVRLMEMERDWS